jgi:hypothetical protein
MPQVLTTNALIVCPHMGLGTSIPSDPKWSVNGGSVLLENDTGTLACPFVPCPCVGYQLRSMGLNATEVDGRKVVLVTDFNQTLTGLPLTMTEFHQTFDDSLPAALPPGYSASASPPELADATKPVVTAVPPAPLAFNSITSLPPVLMAGFTISSNYPLKWMLTLINGTTGLHLDATNGLPGLVVLPPGGTWSSPTLVVSLTLAAPFMAALGVGRHQLYMTAVNRRGLNSYATVDLLVT